MFSSLGRPQEGIGAFVPMSEINPGIIGVGIVGGIAILVPVFLSVRWLIRRQETEEEREIRERAEEENRRHRTEDQRRRRAKANAAFLNILSLTAGLAAVIGIGSWLTTTPANAVQQILAGIWLICGLLGLVAVTLATGARLVADAIREKG